MQKMNFLIKINFLILVQCLTLRASAMSEIEVDPNQTALIELEGKKYLEIFHSSFIEDSEKRRLKQPLDSINYSEIEDFEFKIRESENRSSTLSLPDFTKRCIFLYLRYHPKELRTHEGFSSFDFLLNGFDQGPSEFRAKLKAQKSQSWDPGVLVVFKKDFYEIEETLEYSGDEGFFAIYLGDYKRERLVICKPFRAGGLVVTTVRMLSKATEVESPRLCSLKI